MWIKSRPRESAILANFNRKQHSPMHEEKKLLGQLISCS